MSRKMKKLRMAVSVVLSLLLLKGSLDSLAMYTFEQVADAGNAVVADEGVDNTASMDEKDDTDEMIDDGDTVVEKEEEDGSYEKDNQIDEAPDVGVIGVVSYGMTTREDVLEVMVERGYVTYLGNGAYQLNLFDVFVIPYDEINLYHSWWNAQIVDLRLSMAEAVELLMRIDGVREIVIDEYNWPTEYSEWQWEMEWWHREILFSHPVESTWGSWQFHGIFRTEDLTIRSAQVGVPVVLFGHLEVITTADLTLVDVLPQAITFRELDANPYGVTCNEINEASRLTLVANHLKVLADIHITSFGYFVFEGELTTDQWVEISACNIMINGNINYVADEIAYRETPWNGRSGRFFPFTFTAERNLILNGNLNITLERFHETNWHPGRVHWSVISAGENLILNGNTNIVFEEYVSMPFDDWSNWHPVFEVAPIYLLTNGNLVVNGDFTTSDTRVFPNFKVFGEGRIDILGGHVVNPNFLIHCMNWSWSTGQLLDCESDGIHVSGGTLINPSFFHRGVYGEQVSDYNITVMSGGTIYGHQPFYSQWMWGEFELLSFNEVSEAAVHDLSFIGNDDWCLFEAYQWNMDNHCFNDATLSIGLMSGGTIRPLWMYDEDAVDDLHVDVTTLSGGFIENVYTEFAVMNGGIIDNRRLEHDKSFFEENTQNCRVVGGRNGDDICFYSSVLMNESVLNGGSIYGATIQFIGDVLMTGGTVAYANNGALFSTDAGAHFTITDGTFRQNTSQFGGVIHLTGGTSFTANGGIFENNQAEIGGVFYLNPLTRESDGRFNQTLIATLTVNEGIFRNNFAQMGGVIGIRDFFNGEHVVEDDLSDSAFVTTQVVINGGLFTDNEAEFGGVFYGFRGDESIHYEEVVTDAQWLWTDYEAYLEHCLEYSEGYGGFDDCFNWYQEQAWERFDTLWNWCLDWRQINQWQWVNPQYASFDDCLARDSFAWLASWINPSSRFVLVYEVELVPRTCTIYVDDEPVEIDCDILPLLIVNGGDFECNQAIHGGVVYLAQGLIDILGGNFTTNQGVNGGALYVAEFDYLLGVQVVDARFENNGANRNGGAIYIADATNQTGATVVVMEAVFDGNVAVGGMGGAIYVTDWNRHGTRTLTEADYLSLVVSESTQFLNNRANRTPSAAPFNPEITAIRSADVSLFETAINNHDVSFYYDPLGLDGDDVLPTMPVCCPDEDSCPVIEDEVPVGVMPEMPVCPDADGCLEVEDEIPVGIMPEVNPIPTVPDVEGELGEGGVVRPTRPEGGDVSVEDEDTASSQQTSITSTTGPAVAGEDVGNSVSRLPQTGMTVVGTVGIGVSLASLGGLVASRRKSKE